MEFINLSQTKHSENPWVNLIGYDSSAIETHLYVTSLVLWFMFFLNKVLLLAVHCPIDLRGFDVVLHRTREFSLSARSLTGSVRETE